MKKSNKFFARYGFKTLCVNWEEKILLDRLVELKRICKMSTSGFVFNEIFDAANTDPKYNSLKNWGRHLRSQLKINIRFNSNKYRKQMCTEWAHKVSDPQMQRAVDEHLGHNRTTALHSYEDYNKKISSRAVSKLVDHTFGIRYLLL